MAEVRQSSVRAPRLVGHLVRDDEDGKDRAWRFRGHGRTSGKTKGKQGISGGITCVECVKCYRYEVLSWEQLGCKWRDVSFPFLKRVLKKRTIKEMFGDP